MTLQLFPVSAIPGVYKCGYLNDGSPPPRSRGVGGWGLAGSFPVLRPCRRAGGGGGQGTALTHDNISTDFFTKSIQSYCPNVNFAFPCWELTNPILNQNNIILSIIYVLGGGGLSFNQQLPFIHNKFLQRPMLLYFITIVYLQNIVTLHWTQKINDTFC